MPVERQMHDTSTTPAKISGFKGCFWRLVNLFVLLTGVMVTATFIFGRWWPLENLGSFRVQYFWLFTLFALIYWIARRLPAAIALTLLAVANAATFVPLYFGGDHPAGDPELRVMYLNVLADNIHYDKFFAAVEAEDPDIVVVAETSSAWVKQLETLKAEYPYHYIDPHLGVFGMAIFSRIEPIEQKAEYWGTRGFPSMVGRYNIDGQPLTLIGLHVVPALSPDRVVCRDVHLAQMATAINNTQDHVLLIGDLNLTGDAPTLRAFRHKTGLRDSRDGFGIQPSWWLLTRLVAIPIDHCLVSEDIAIHDRRLGPRIGSDHRPVTVDVSFDGSP